MFFQITLRHPQSRLLSGNDLIGGARLQGGTNAVVCLSQLLLNALIHIFVHMDIDCASCFGRITASVAIPANGIMQNFLSAMTRGEAKRASKYPGVTQARWSGGQGSLAVGDRR